MNNRRNDEYEADIWQEAMEKEEELKTIPKSARIKELENAVREWSWQWLDCFQEGNEAKKMHFEELICNEMLDLHNQYYSRWKVVRQYEDIIKYNGFVAAIKDSLNAMKNQDKDEQEKDFIKYFSFIYPKRVVDAFYKEYPEKQLEKEEREKEIKKRLKEGESIDSALEDTIESSIRFFSLDATLSTDGKRSWSEVIPDENNGSSECEQEDTTKTNESLAAAGLAKQTAQILNFTEKLFGRRKANPTRRLWFRMFYTEYITYIAKIMQKVDTDISYYINEEEIFQALRTNIAACNMQESAERYLDYYMSLCCKTLRDIGFTEMKLYDELENFERDFDFSKKGTRISIFEEGEKVGRMPQDVSVGYMKKHQKAASEQGASDFYGWYKEYMAMSQKKMRDEIEKGENK